MADAWGCPGPESAIPRACRRQLGLAEVSAALLHARTGGARRRSSSPTPRGTGGRRARSHTSACSCGATWKTQGRLSLLSLLAVAEAGRTAWGCPGLSLPLFEADQAEALSVASLF